MIVDSNQVQHVGITEAVAARVRTRRQHELEVPITIPLIQPGPDARLMSIKAIEVSTGSEAVGVTHSGITFECPFGDPRCSTLHIVVLDHSKAGTLPSALRQPFVACLDHALRVGNWEALHEFAIVQSYAGFRLELGPNAVFVNVSESLFPLPLSKAETSVVVGGVPVAGPGTHALLRAVTGSKTPRERELNRAGHAFVQHALLWQHMVRYWTMQGSSYSDPEVMQYLAAAFHQKPQF